MVADCGHIAYRGHDDVCIEDGCKNAAYQVFAATPGPAPSEPPNAYGLKVTLTAIGDPPPYPFAPPPGEPRGDE